MKELFLFLLFTLFFPSMNSIQSERLKESTEKAKTGTLWIANDCTSNSNNLSLWFKEIYETWTISPFKNSPFFNKCKAKMK